MNRRRFIRTALAAAAAVPVFPSSLMGNEKPVAFIDDARLHWEINGGPAHKPYIVSAWSPVTVEMQDRDGNWVSLMTKARARRIADEYLERYAHPVVTFEVNGQAVDEELLVELDAKGHRGVGA